MVGEGERGIQTGRKGRKATLLSNSTGKIVKWWKDWKQSFNPSNFGWIGYGELGRVLAPPLSPLFLFSCSLLSNKWILFLPGLFCPTHFELFPALYPALKQSVNVKSLWPQGEGEPGKGRFKLVTSLLSIMHNKSIYSSIIYQDFWRLYKHVLKHQGIIQGN